MSDTNPDVTLHSDFAGMKPVHVLPYKIKSHEYGDYPYSSEHDESELVADSRAALAVMIRDLVERHMDAWAKLNSNLYTAKTWDLPALQRFKLSEPWSSFDFTEGTPRLGLHYVEFGAYRVELRDEDGYPPDIMGGGDFTFAGLHKAMADRLPSLRDELQQAVINAEGKAAAGAKAAKRAQLAALKAELGED